MTEASGIKSKLSTTIYFSCVWGPFTPWRGCGQSTFDSREIPFCFAFAAFFPICGFFSNFETNFGKNPDILEKKPPKLEKKPRNWKKCRKLEKMPQIGKKAAIAERGPSGVQKKLSYMSEEVGP